MKLGTKYLYIIIIGLILLLIVGYWLSGGKKSAKKASSSIIPTEAAIPWVDSSVKIDLIALRSGKEVLLKIDNIPSNTQLIDYELTYQTKQQGFQGIIGTIRLNNEKKYEKKLILGTSSSGVYVYHNVVGKIKLTLRFSGSYGERIFEKEYQT